MFSRSLFTSVLIRVMLILLSGVAFVVIIPFLHKEYYLSLIGIGIIIIYQVYLLVNYINKTNRKLAQFFNSVRNEDTELVFSHISDEKSFDSLNASLDNVKNTIGEMRRKSASHNLFLNDLVEHVPVGLISFNDDGEISIFNKAAKELLQISRLRNIKDLNNIYPDLINSINDLKPHNQQVVRILTKQSVLYLSLKLSLIKGDKGTTKLVSVQNIRTALEHNELDSWQKLIRVLTHEISNSVSPINSLANTTKRYFVEKDSNSIVNSKDLNEILLKKTVDSLETIESTGKSLIEFVEKYKSISALPEPKFKTFRIIDLFHKLEHLHEKQFNEQNIELFIDVIPENMELTADPVLLENVMMNLIKNAIQAMEKSINKTMHLKAFVDFENRNVISIKDSGSGISPEIFDDIFIPFYTTKEHGSGIGLSLARQIMRLHMGTITVNSIQEKETEFYLVF